MACSYEEEKQDLMGRWRGGTHRETEDGQPGEAGGEAPVDRTGRARRHAGGPRHSVGARSRIREAEQTRRAVPGAHHGRALRIDEVSSVDGFSRLPA